MKHSKKHSTSEKSIEKKFRNAQNTQDSIQGLTVWAIHHQDHAEKIVSIWAKVLTESKSPHTLTMMYICNDIVQNCKRKNAVVYKDLFKQYLPDVISLFSKDEAVIPNIQRIFKIWSDRSVYDETVISGFQENLISNDIRDKLQQEEIDKKLLAEFKPNKVVESLRGFRRLELDADMKYRQISNLRLDLTNSEAIKQLKDRAHGSEYTQQFEDHSGHLEEFHKDLEKVMQERTALIELLELTEHFYELQYGEALVVANAYKNFGLRVAKQESQLEDILKTFPGSSPLSSPQHASLIQSQVIDMEMSDDERGDDEEPPVEPYSPSLMDSPEAPVGSPISPNTSMTDLHIVKGAVQPYDPMESEVRFNPQSLMDNVYNPKAALDTRNNDVSHMHNPLSLSSNADGDGTPTQDEYDPVSMNKDVASNEDDWDLAYEFLEENMGNSSGAVSISNLTTIQTTTDFTAESNLLRKGGNSHDASNSHRPGVHGDAVHQNGANSSMSSPPVLSLSHGSNDSLPSEDDPNAKAQLEFLERLTKRGPFKPSRYLQKLTESKEKKIEPASTDPSSEPQFGRSTQEPAPVLAPPSVLVPTPVLAPLAAAVRPKVEYRIGGVRPPVTASSPVPVGTLQSPSVEQISAIPAPSFPAALKPNDHANSFSPDFPTEFASVDQDMRQFNPARPPPPPPPPRPFMNNAPTTPTGGLVIPPIRGGKPFQPNRLPPPPPPGFQRMMAGNARVDSPRPWPPVPPPGPPPPFFRQRFSGFDG